MDGLVYISLPANSRGIDAATRLLLLQMIELFRSCATRALWRQMPGCGCFDAGGSTCSWPKDAMSVGR